MTYIMVGDGGIPIIDVDSDLLGRIIIDNTRRRYEFKIGKL